ncbi:MAG: hypothetical protein MI748_02950 [Opitutales bacterium]|nr:hypothetical protein [Opitutales bacterium]
MGSLSLSAWKVFGRLDEAIPRESGHNGWSLAGPYVDNGLGSSIVPVTVFTSRLVLALCDFIVGGEGGRRLTHIHAVKNSLGNCRHCVLQLYQAPAKCNAGLPDRATPW